MDEKTKMIALNLCVEALEKINSQRIYKIGLICEPPHFVYENMLKVVREKYDLIREPMDVRNSLVELLKTEYAQHIVKDIPWVQELVMNWPESVIKLHEESCGVDMYSKVNHWHSVYVLQKLADVKTYNHRPTIYDLPVLEVEYNQYFDKLLKFNCTEEQALEESQDFLEHVEEEGIPKELELELTKAQRLHFKQTEKKVNWITQ